MNYPRGALTTQAEVDAALEKNGKIYCVEPSGHNGRGLGPWAHPTGIEPWGRPFRGWNLTDGARLSYIHDFLFANYWDAWAYAEKVKHGRKLA